MSNSPIVAPLNRESPAVGAVAVTPSNSADLAVPARALYVGEAGDLAVHMVNGDIVTFTGMPVGFVPISVRRVLATGTTATGIVALY
jgi:hypothetical protein